MSRKIDQSVQCFNDFHFYVYSRSQLITRNILKKKGAFIQIYSTLRFRCCFRSCGNWIKNILPQASRYLHTKLHRNQVSCYDVIE